MAISTSDTTAGYIYAPNVPTRLSSGTFIGYADPVDETRVVEKEAQALVLALKDELDVLSPTPPTQEQWDKVRDKIAKHVARTCLARIRKSAEPYPATPRPSVNAYLLQIAQLQAAASMDELKFKTLIASAKQGKALK